MSLKIVLSGRIRHFKKIILKGRGFRGGSDEKMRRMWFGLEIDVVGLPPLTQRLYGSHCILSIFLLSSPDQSVNEATIATQGKYCLLSFDNLLMLSFQNLYLL